MGWIAVLAVASLFGPQAAQAQNVIRMQEITIEGEVQKPQASYILQRSGKVDLGVDVRSFRPNMSARHGNVLDQQPELYDTRRR